MCAFIVLFIDKLIINNKVKAKSESVFVSEQKISICNTQCTPIKIFLHFLSIFQFYESRIISCKNQKYAINPV